MKNKGPWISTLIGSVVLAVPCLASASAPSPNLLGEIDAIGNYCRGLGQSQGDWNAVLREFNRQFGAEASSADFRAAYSQMTAALNRLSKPQGRALCGVKATGKSGEPEGRR
jgi:hypothetical protein